MISNTIFITYTVMCFLGLQALTLAVIIIRHNKKDNKKLFKATMVFVLVSLALGLFYYITYYRELVLGQFEANFILRGIDALVFYAMGFSWIKLMDAIIDSKNPKMDRLRRITSRFFIILMACSSAIYIFLLDEFYSTSSLWAEIFVISGEIILGLSVIFFTAAYWRLGQKELKDKFNRKYVIAISIFVNFNNIWNNTVVIAVFIKAVSLSLWCSKLYGVTSIVLLIINLYTLVYIYVKDFSPLYLNKNSKPDEGISEKDALNIIASKYRLTERERDVMLIAYEGLTNPEIAERLFISKYTVKRHMHNIFEKLQITSRIELVHMVKAKTASK